MNSIDIDYPHPQDYTPNRCLTQIKSCLELGDLHPFYTSPEWERLREQVLVMDKHECQFCKAAGSYRRAEVVHHISHVREHPELALSVCYWEAGELRRNLISVCRVCHETVCHPERMRKKKKFFATLERWD